MAKRTFIIKVKIKSKKKNLPDWGLGPGILADQEVSFDDTNIPKETIAYQLNNLYAELVKNNIESVYEEKK
jgi:hypothetical protein